MVVRLGGRCFLTYEAEVFLFQHAPPPTAASIPLLTSSRNLRWLVTFLT